MKSEVEKELLSKVMVLIERIKGQIQETGLSKRQIATYFARRIFKTEVEVAKQCSGQIFINKQFQIWLGAKREAKISIKTMLIQLLAILEIENEWINQYESYQPEKSVVVRPVPKKHTQHLNLEVTVLKKREMKGFWEKLRQDQRTVRESPIRNPTPHSALLQDFQRQLNESLMKTKQLKRLIQQKISEQLQDPYTSRIRHMHNMLALQSN